MRPIEGCALPFGLLTDWWSVDELRMPPKKQYFEARARVASLLSPGIELCEEA
jgi:hypothetical protein